VVLEGKDLELLKNQAPGWRVTVSESTGKQSLVQEWKGKDAAAASEIQKLLLQVPGAEDHKPVSVNLQEEIVTVELSTSSVGEVCRL
jgi:pterin-4a-carbinolamine dehydratase